MTDVRYRVFDKKIPYRADQRLGMEAEALNDYTPNEQTELEFKCGEILLLLDYGDNFKWYTAQAHDRIGLVPSNYIEVLQTSWYYGRISRVLAERMLEGSSYEGAFLVRLSESSPKDFSLSVRCGNLVQHFRILKDKDEKYRLWADGPAFVSINKLVEQYKHETVSRTRRILLRRMEDAEPPRFVVQARYDFEPDMSKEDSRSELGFKKGDFIWVVDTSDKDWWIGEMGTRRGYFPAIYVQLFNLDSVATKEAEDQM